MYKLILVVWIAGLLTLAGNAAAAPSALDPQFCLAPSDAAQDFREFVMANLVSDDSTDLQGSGLSTVDTAEVVFVTAADSLTCRQAAEAHAARHGEDVTNPPPVYVLRAGATRYFVFNYTKQGEYHAYSIFDENFHHVLDWIG
jgi:hypothetical protein